MPCIMVGMDQKDSNYDTSWLSEDLEIDPIIDEPIDTSAALAVAQDIRAEVIIYGSHFHGVWVRPEEHRSAGRRIQERVSTLTCTAVTRRKRRSSKMQPPASMQRTISEPIVLHLKEQVSSC